jgi:hypothetical protein
MTTSTVKKFGQLISEEIADDALLSVRCARERDGAGFPTVKGLPIDLGGETWLVPARKPPVMIRIHNGKAEAASSTDGKAEVDFLSRVGIMAVDDCSEDELIAAGVDFLLDSLRVNYDLDDLTAETLLNADFNETEAAIENVMLIRLLPKERGGFATRMMMLARRWAELHAAYFVDANDGEVEPDVDS